MSARDERDARLRAESKFAAIAARKTELQSEFKVNAHAVRDKIAEQRTLRLAKEALAGSINAPKFVERRPALILSKVKRPKSGLRAKPGKIAKVKPSLQKTK